MRRMAGIVLMLVVASAHPDPGEARAVFSRNAVIVIIAIIVLFSVYLLLREAAVRIIWKRAAREPRWLLITASAIILLSILAALYARFVEPDWVRTARYRFATEKWKSSASIRFAQLSDLHTEKASELRFRRALDLVRKADPDIIFLTGDYINDSSRETKKMLGNFASSLVEVAPVYAIEGNWDTASALQILEEKGARVLRNEKTDIELKGANIRLIGSDSFRYDLLKKLLAPDPTTYIVVLSHTPLLFERSAPLGADLYLCGHTHGGQIRLPLYGTVCPYYELIGKYQLGKYCLGTTTMIVNGGIGMEGGIGVVRVRFCDRPEVGIIEVSGTR